MKNAAIVLLIIAVTAIGIFAYYQFNLLQELKARLEQPVSTTANLDLQQRCARQAREEFTYEGWDKQPMASFANHYNSDLNKCFLEIENTSQSNTTLDVINISKTLSDAFEGKAFAQYMWQSQKGKKYWEVPPFICTVTLPSGGEKICHSSDEFDELIKVYMQ